MSAAAVMRRSNRRSARGTSSVAFFTNVLAGLMVLRGSISRHACLASVLLNASSFLVGRYYLRVAGILSARDHGHQAARPRTRICQGTEFSHLIQA